MNNIVKDIQENCPECDCDIERTIAFLKRNGDLTFSSEHYREIWFFYSHCLENGWTKKLSRETTMELYCISHEKFKYIQKWWARTHG